MVTDIDGGRCKFWRQSTACCTRCWISVGHLHPMIPFNHTWIMRWLLDRAQVRLSSMRVQQVLRLLNLVLWVDKFFENKLSLSTFQFCCRGAFGHNLHGGLQEIRCEDGRSGRGRVLSCLASSRWFCTGLNPLNEEFIVILIYYAFPPGCKGIACRHVTDWQLHG